MDTVYDISVNTTVEEKYLYGTIFCQDQTQTETSYFSYFSFHKTRC